MSKSHSDPPRTRSAEHLEKGNQRNDHSDWCICKRQEANRWNKYQTRKSGSRLWAYFQAPSRDGTIESQNWTRRGISKDVLMRTLFFFNSLIGPRSSFSPCYFLNFTKIHLLVTVIEWQVSCTSSTVKHHRGSPIYHRCPLLLQRLTWLLVEF